MNKSGFFQGSSEGFLTIDAGSIRRMVATSSDFALRLDADGKVVNVIIGVETLVGEDINMLVGLRFRDTLTSESIPKFEALILGASRHDPPKWRQMNHKTDTDVVFPVSYAAVPEGDDGTVLLLGRDKRELMQMQQRLVEAQLTIEQDYERIRQVESRYRVLFETGADALVIISADTGKIIDANSASARLLQREPAELLQRSFASKIATGSQRALSDTLELVRTKGGHKTVQLALKGDNRKIWLDALLFRSVSDTLVLCRLRPLTAAMDDRDVFGNTLLALYDRTGDAVVFTDRDGLILHANAAFQSLANVSMVEHLQRVNFGTFLGRPTVDLNVMSSNAEQAGRMSVYATTLRTEFGSQIAVEISTTYLADQTPPGFGFVIRDVSRLEASRQSSSAVSSEAVEHVVDLVGSTPLRELVRGTTDVVEKLCIETAIRLTNNNRAAAAEMLGLSRQSLYVKLRRYGLVDQED